MPDAAALAAAAQILIRIDTGEKNTAQELDELWAQLPTVRIEEILGSWRGGELPTGYPMDGQLEQVGWYGKNFISRTNVQPLVCRNADGELYPTRSWARVRPASGTSSSAAR